ncbi:MAG: TraB/GumN family protein [Treponema sp.]|nr:TraB/GumN family protein [Treponema sp.]MBP5751655.1 TraB/GumN family protein [Treponema sp.]
MKKVFSLISVCFAVLFFISCASIPKAQLQPQERFYWTIEGTSKNGQPSYVHILGTIHMGDDRLYPLPETVMNDFNKSKRVVAEIGSDDMNELELKIVTVMMDSMLKAHGHDLSKELTPEELEFLVNQLGMQTFTVLSRAEPWLITYTLASLQWTNSGLTSEKGIDTVLMGMLRNAGRKWEGLDTIDFQLKVLRYGTYEQQLYMLKDEISELMDTDKSDELMLKMYEAYLNTDLEMMTEVCFDDDEEQAAEMEDLEPEIVEFLVGYNDLILTQRNKSWAEKIKEWLKEGEETFIFAGSAHFLGSESVFEYLKKNGVLPRD